MNAATARIGSDAAETPNEFEGEIREFIRRDRDRDLAQVRRLPQAEASEQAVGNINSLLERVSGSSVGEIDRLIADLGNVRNFLASEGERIQREIQGYAQLSQIAMNSVKTISDSVTQWKSQVGEARLDRT